MKQVQIILFTVLLFSGAALGNNPNPCANVPGNETFRNDWSSCAAYFWCNFGEAVHTVPCPLEQGFNETSQSCTFAAATCEECPEDINLAVANPDDNECRSNFFCAGGNRTTELVTCAQGLRFNRATGICDLETNVSCFIEQGSGNPVEPEPTPEPEIPGGGCPPGLTGDYNSNGCNMFIRCINGTQTGPFSCGVLHFNPSTRSCDLPANLSPPCTT